MQERTMEGEFDNFVSSTFAEHAQTPEEFTPWVSMLDVHVRRADSVAVSVLADTVIEQSCLQGRWLQGTTYDSVTGEQLMLSDVVRDIRRLSPLVAQGMSGNMWMTDGFDADAVQSYFDRTPEDGISWTLDYCGISFYFASDDFVADGSTACATIPFVGNEDLFYDQYVSTPDSYMVSLPIGVPFFCDLVAEGMLEIDLLATEAEAFAHEANTDLYTGFGIHSGSTDSIYCYEDMTSWGFHPYYLKTADGAHWLYLFCNETESPNGPMRLLVYRLTRDAFTKVGEAQLGLYRKPEGALQETVFAALTNPENMLLQDAVDSVLPYRVGSDGMPIQN